jgi:DNA helicase-2/ATP-dependent DNA helicase PcrA
VRAAREGAPVAIDVFPDESHALLVIGSALGALIDREPRASIAVIAGDEDVARRVHGALEDLPRARLVLDGSFTFEPGLDVTHVDAVKGLEWDYVVIPDATARTYPDEREPRRRLHVAITRASHQAWIVSGGEPTAIVA